MVNGQNIVDAIVEKLLRPQLQDPNQRRDSDNFIYSDFPTAKNRMPRIGVETTGSVSTGSQRLSTTRQYVEETVTVQIREQMDIEGEAFEQNRDYSDYPGTSERPEQGIKAMEEKVKNVVADDLDKRKSESVLRSLDDQEIVIVHAATTPVGGNSSEQKVLNVDFEATYCA